MFYFRCLFGRVFNLVNKVKWLVLYFFKFFMKCENVNYFGMVGVVDMINDCFLW